MNEFIEHPTIMYCTFESFIFKIDDHWYVQEDYQDGEIWSEDEIWGSILYDLENKRKIYLTIYVTSKSDWEYHIYNQSNWEEMDYEFEDWHLYGDAIEYYQNEINRLKNEELERKDI